MDLRGPKLVKVHNLDSSRKFQETINFEKG